MRGALTGITVGLFAGVADLVVKGSGMLFIAAWVFCVLKAASATGWKE